MSLHKKPAYNHEAIRQALRAHGMEVDNASQVSDGFRLGWTAAMDAVRGQAPSHGVYDKPEEEE